MRCREVRLRLTEFRRGKPADIEDREMMDHLAVCPECAREAKAVHTLRQMLEAAAANDTAEMMPLSVQKRVVEARAAQLDRRPFLRRLIRASDRNVARRRVRFGIGIAAAVFVLALVSLVPFRYDRTVGYDIAFAGVCRELAADDERICNVLFELGLHEADIDLSDCDLTCDLTVVDLKSKEEVDLVLAAFSGLCHDDPSADVIPVVTSTSGSLIHQANEKIFTGRPAD